MGKARVTDNLGEGQYDFELIYSDERAQARIDFLAEIIGLNEDLQLVKLQADLAVAQAEVNVQADKVDAAIADWIDAGTWTSDTDYSIGDRVRINGLATMLCEQSGRSGGIIPAWPDKHGDTIRENHVNWNMSVEDQLGGSFWSTSTNYSINDKVIAVPNILVEGEPKNIYATATLNGRSGFFEPSWTQSGTITEGGVIWRREDRLQAIVEANKELLERRVKRDKAAADVQVLKTYILSWKREKAFIERHLPAQVLKVAGWCADYSPDIPIDTEVETAEVTGFHHGGLTSAGKASDRTVLIRPQEPPADYPPSILTPAGDVVQLSEVPAGKLRHAVACTPSECLYALMIEPGAEKWRPTWRVGVIDSIDRDADTCSVTLLFADAPRYSDLPVQHNINETVVLTDVPIRYMSCNSAAFEVGDRVLIEYPNQDRAFPTVRGFESNPRACPGGLLCSPVSDAESLGLWLFNYKSGWRVRSDVSMLAGNVNWIGASDVVSWSGSMMRAVAPEPQTLIIAAPVPTVPLFAPVNDTAGDLYNSGGTKTHFCYIFQRFTTSFWHRGQAKTGPGDLIVGAAIKEVGGVKYYFVLTTSNGTRTDRFYRRIVANASDPWELIGSWVHPSGHGLHETGWFINESATEAQCIIKEWVERTPATPGSDIVHAPRRFVATIGPASVSVAAAANGTPIQRHFVRDVSGSGDCYEAARTTTNTETWSGAEIVAVDYAADAAVFATLSDSRAGSETSNTDAVNMSRSGSSSGERTLAVGGNSIVISSTVGSNTGSLSGSAASHTSTLTDVRSCIIYLDLRFAEALVYRLDISTVETRSSDAAPVFDDVDYVFDQTADRKIYRLSDNATLCSGSVETSTSETLSFYDWTGTFFCADFAVDDLSDQNANIWYGYDPYSAFNLNSLIAEINKPASLDSSGRLFASLKSTLIDPNLSPDYVNLLDSGDPVALTGLAGANPRFYPIMLA